MLRISDRSCSIFLSDFDVSNALVEFEMRANGPDDDWIGFVFGYQDIGSFYQFSWSRDTRSSPSMGVNLANVGSVDPYNKVNPVSPSLFSVLEGDSIGWHANTQYHITLEFVPGLFDIKVLDPGGLVRQFNIADNTFTNGKFGFYTFSQDNVNFSNLEITGLPPINAVPVPAAIWLFGTALIGFLGFGKRRKQLVQENRSNVQPRRRAGFLFSEGA